MQSVISTKEEPALQLECTERQAKRACVPRLSSCKNNVLAAVAE